MDFGRRRRKNRLQLGMEKYGVNLVRPWLQKISKANEGGTVVAFPGSGISRILFDSAIGLEDFQNCGEFDASLFGVDIDRFEDNLVDLAEKIISSGGKYLIISWLNFDRKSSVDKLFVLKTVRNTLAKKINFVIVSSVDPKFVNKELMTEFHEILFSNKCYLPYSDGDEWKKLIIQNQFRYGKKISDVEEKLMYKLSGGCPYLTKFLWKRLSDGIPLGDDTEPVNLVANLLRKLPKRWVVWCQNLDLIDEDKIKMLRDVGLLGTDNKIKSELFDLSLNKYEVAVRIAVTEDLRIVLGSTDITESFSESEKEIIMYLLKNKKVTRTEVATICWGENRTEEYSEYALDKLMSNLRKKMVWCGIPRNFIETVKGVGFKTNGS